MVSARPRLRCSYCFRSVFDLRGHQRRSRACRICQAVYVLRDQGYCSLNWPEPEALFGLPHWDVDLQVVPWWRRDNRVVILSGPSGVHYPRGHVEAVRSVWVHESVEAWDLPTVLSRALARRVEAAGGWIPYRRAHPKKPYPGPRYDMAAILWEWTQAGDVQAQLERYGEGPLHGEVPEYVNDRRVVCECCGAKILKRSLSAHQQTTRCIASWMARRRMVYVLAFHASRDDNDPGWAQASASQVAKALAVHGIEAEYHRLRVDYEGRPHPFVSSSYISLGDAYVVWVPADQEAWARSLLKTAGMGMVLVTAPGGAKALLERLADPELFWMAVGESLVPSH